MTATDGIAIAQAVALAAGALFAWRTYRLARDERRAEAAERRAAERRRLLKDVVDELKNLADRVEEIQLPVGNRRDDLVGAAQQRLTIALGFVPEPLPQTRLAARLPAHELQRGQISAAADELAEVATELAPGGGVEEPAPN